LAAGFLAAFEADFLTDLAIMKKSSGTGVLKRWAKILGWV
jgi:hypothetical protein